MKMYACFLLVIALLASCKNTQDQTLFSMRVKEVSDLQFSGCSSEKIILDSTGMTSLSGALGIRHNDLYFLDYLTCKYFQFDTSGQLKFQALGYGRGPKETPVGNIVAHVFTQSGDLILQGGSDDVYLHDSTLTQKIEYRKFRRPYKSKESLAYDAFELYSTGYPVVCRSYEGKAFTNNRAEMEEFNYFETPDIFVEEFRCITEEDVPNQRTGRLLGKGMPELFHGTSEKYRLFSSVQFDIDNEGSFYVSFQADPHIYKFDKNFIPIAAFGSAGKAMDLNYRSIPPASLTRKNVIEESASRGYYTWVEYIDELGYLLRSYQRGGNASQDGLQIYKENVLLGDIEVPKGFQPMGYLHPYIYSQAVVENDRLCYYRIKLI